MSSIRLSKSPFLQSVSSPQVHVSRGKGAYENTVAALARVDLTPAYGKRVLLKPNAGRIAKPDSGITTNPQVIAAAIDVFRKAGADVAVGESPISGVRTMEAFEATGIAQIARERECPLIDMDANPPVDVEVPEGIAIRSLKVCPELFDYDIIVSVPVMKMHMHTGVTLAVKNMKGCLWRRSKVMFHMLPPIKGTDEKPINIAIADMSNILKPQLSIIDGTVAMEGLGPSAGKAKPFDVVVVGDDPFAADAVACRLMDIHAEDVPHLRIGAERGYGIIDLAHIKITPDNWQDWISPFLVPPTNLSIEFPNITVLDKNSCSACQSTLLLFLTCYRDQLFDYFPSGSITIAIGKGNENVPEGTLCIGNCTIRHRECGIFIPGCPPVSSEILSIVSGKPSFDIYDGHSEIPNIPAKDDKMSEKEEESSSTKKNSFGKTSKEKEFPCIWQAILLLLGCFSLLVCGGLILGMLLETVGLISGADKALIFAIGEMFVTIGAFISISGLALFLTKTSFKKLFAVFGFNPAFFFPLLLSLFGLSVLVSEIDNVTRYIIPMPEFIVQIFKAIFRDPVTSLISLVVVAPFTEELLFRGIILRGFLTHYTTKKAVIVSALLFALFHGNPYQILPAFLIGVLLGWVFFEMRSLWLCMLVHAFHNLLCWLCAFNVFNIEIRGYTNTETGLFPETCFQPWWFNIIGFLCFCVGLALLNKTFKKVKSRL